MNNVICTTTIVVSALFCGLVAAGEKDSSKVVLPGASIEMSNEYSGSKRDYEKAVHDKKEALKTKGGEAMVNEAKQPVKESTIRTERGIGAKGFGYSESREKSLGKTSAAEEALRTHRSAK
jgi:hypothetical protein